MLYEDLYQDGDEPFVTSEELVTRIHGTISDLVLNFVVYDRKEDGRLPRGVMEAAIKDGHITVDEIVDSFRQDLVKISESST